MSHFIFYDYVSAILKEAFESQQEVLEAVAQEMTDVIATGHLIYVFGAGHAGILAEELFYRAGGLVPINPIFAPGLTTTTRPATLETELERLSGYAQLLLDASKITPADLLIIHSNSGRNTVAIEMGELARERGIKVVAITSIKHSESVTSRHPRGLKLMDIADYVIDNWGVVGDAVVELKGLDQRVGASSTIIGAALVNALVVEVAQKLLKRGLEPPIFCSANVDNSQANNQRWLAHYGPRLLYL